MDLGKGLGLLTYSTLVHPGDTWDEMWHSLTTFVPRVKERVAPKEPFGVSLRLSNASAELLVHDKSRREQLKKFLGDGDLLLRMEFVVGQRIVDRLLKDLHVGQ